MPSRIAMITFLDDGPPSPVDPGYGRPGWGPVDPGFGVRPPVDPGYGHPGFSPGHPSQGLPGGGHISTGPVYPPGHPSQGLPVVPVYPSHELPAAPVDPAWGYSPHLGWFIVYCKGGANAGQLPSETPEPKV
jgi:hypothetical protein